MAAPAKYAIIGTAGHVDHGKTQLIKALTGIDTDRLAEEKKRGITIELGFAWLDLPGGEKAGIVDVPGHEKFVKNMLAGAGGIDLALLIVAADDGVMPQTREHLGILSLLGVQNGIVVITKADLVDEDWVEMVMEDLKKETAGTFLENAPMQAVSAHTGVGIPELRELIYDRVKLPDNNTAVPFRLPVDRVFSVEGFGTVVTGTLIEGALSEGDEVETYPSGEKSRVRNLQVHSQDAPTAFAGQRVAVNLAGIKKDEISRGDTVAAPGSMQQTLMLDVKVRVLKDSRRVLQNGSRLHFYHGAREDLCKLVLLGQEAVAPGEECFAQLRFVEEVAAKKGDRFVLRFYSPVETVAGGVILDANPAKHRRNDARVRDALDKREKGSAADNLLVAVSDASPNFIPLPDIQKHIAMDDATFKTELEGLIESGQVVRLSSRTAISADFEETLGRRLVKIMRDYHKQNPLQSGMRKDELRGKLLPGREIGLADKVLSLFEADGLITIDGQKAALAGFKIEYSDADKKLSETIEKFFADAAFTPPSPDEAYTKSKDRAAVKRVYDALCESGALVVTPSQMVFHRDAVNEAWKMVREFAEQNGQITLAEFRDLIGASRKYALPLLELFDRQGKTKKIDDARVLV